VAGIGSSHARIAGYRTRRPKPAVLLAVILSTVAGLVWFSALYQTGAGCPRPHGLDTVPPAPPQLTRVHVLNANGVPGKAATVDAALTQLGFATTTPANDPQYPAFNLHCYGEIRFGAAGQAGARTLSLAVPCAELVRDLRPDATIDLALGTKFVALRLTEAARIALLDLAGLGQPAPAVSSRGLSGGPSRGGLAAPVGPQSMTQFVTELTQPVPVVNPDLLHRARQVKC
jgi:LytR cell envelope-related transcriptional attenuator